MKLQIFDRFSGEYANIKFHENPSSGSRIVPREQADKHDEANSRFSHFFERAWKWKFLELVKGMVKNKSSLLFWRFADRSSQYIYLSI